MDLSTFLTTVLVKAMTPYVNMEVRESLTYRIMIFFFFLIDMLIICQWEYVVAVV